MKTSQVNQTVARDLVSNAGNSRVGDMNDFAGKSGSGTGGFSLPNRPQGESRAEDDLRSVRSEYDYGSKKKFVDVLGNVS